MTRAQETIGVREAAQRLGFTMKYLYDLIYTGRLEAKKVGRSWRIPAQTVEARLKQRAQ
jgi:excisionase family DNA binding protein